MNAQLDLDVREAARIALMPRANWAVAQAMIPGVWYQLAEIARRAGLSENGTSTRISENAREYGLKYAKRKLTKSRWEYVRLV